jgi:hypothetical protein
MEMPDRDLMQGWRPGLSNTAPQAMLDQLVDAYSAVIDAAHCVYAVDINGRDYAGRRAELADDHRLRLEVVGLLNEAAERLMVAAMHVADHVTRAEEAAR